MFIDLNAFLLHSIAIINSISNFAGGDWQAIALDEGLWASLDEGFAAGC